MNTEKKQDWQFVEDKMYARFGHKPSLAAILFLIGLQELRLTPTSMNKSQKQDVIHAAICYLLAKHDYFRLLKYDEEGWPHYVPDKSLENVNDKEKNQLLKTCILDYFKTRNL